MTAIKTIVRLVFGVVVVFPVVLVLAPFVLFDQIIRGE
jgi:hypothetical protein